MGAAPLGGLSTTLPVRSRNGDPAVSADSGVGDLSFAARAGRPPSFDTAPLPSMREDAPAPPDPVLLPMEPTAAPVITPPPALTAPIFAPTAANVPPAEVPAAQEFMPAPVYTSPPLPVYTPPVIESAPPAPVEVAPAAVEAAPPPVEAPGVALRPANAATTGALVLLPQEEVVTQLGALYLTNKRVILYAPTILRAAFVRDVDAVGTITERASGWTLFFALLVLGIAGVGVYLAVLQNQLSTTLPGLYQFPLWLIIGVLAVLGGVLLFTYFFWVKKSLFLSVGGRPLIVISLSGWSNKKLEGVDTFVNAFSQTKDATEYPQG
jgi:hypothetical protein